MRHLLLFSVTCLVTATPTCAADAPAYTVTGSIAGPDGGWDYTSFDPDTRTVFVARGNSVTAADPASGTTRAFGTLAKGHAVVPIPDQHLLLVTSGHDDSVRLMDVATGTEKARIAVGTDPDAAFYDATAHRAVVMNAKAGTVSVIEVTAAKVTRTIKLKPGLEFGALGPKATLFVNNEDTNEIETANLDIGTA
jgi:YVTN family beta-propeller protein